jgi:plasmid stability protein
MASLQVRSIDEELYRVLGRRAEMENRSISQEVVSILKQYLGAPQSSHVQATRQFLELAGTWKDERSASAIANDIVRGRYAAKRRTIKAW